MKRAGRQAAEESIARRDKWPRPGRKQSKAFEETIELPPDSSIAKRERKLRKGVMEMVSLHSVPLCKAVTMVRIGRDNFTETVSGREPKDVFFFLPLHPPCRTKQGCNSYCELE